MRSPLWLLLLIACGGADGAAPEDTAADTDAGDTDEVDPTDEPAADTWDDFAAGFFATYCVSCHATSPKDFTLHEEVIPFADAIRCGVAATELEGCDVGPAPAQFPAGSGPMPSDEERERLVAWVELGMP